MSRQFDPDQIRIHWTSIYDHALEQVDQAFNAGFWSNAVAQVTLAHFVGATEDPRWKTPQLLTLSRTMLRRHLMVPEADASTDRLFTCSHAFMALGLADWIATGQRQRETFGVAHDIHLRYFELASARKKPGLEYGVYPCLRHACLAERTVEAEAFIAKHLDAKKLTPSKARHIAELCRGMSTEPAPHGELGRRYLRARVGRALARGGHLDGAECFYLASIAGVPGSPAELLGSVREYISYLRPKATSKKVTRFSEMTPHQGVRRLYAKPRPERILASSAGREQIEWKEVPAGWGLHVRYGLSRPGPDRDLFEARAKTLVEWSQVRGVYPHHAERPWEMSRLTRATLNADTLAQWSRSEVALPLEVAFAPNVEAWIDGRRLSLPPTLRRREWKDTLQVGALENLRALSLESRESEKDRIKRGDAPYLIVPTWFVTSPLAGQLEALEVTARPHDLSVSLELFDALPNLRELVIWMFYDRLHTACFWIERGKPVLIQSVSGFQSRQWSHVLEQSLTARAVERLKTANATTIHPNIAGVREQLQRYIPVDQVTLGAPLREL